MIIGQTIVACDDGVGNDSVTVYTPWISSAGNTAVFPFELQQLGGVLASVKVQVYTKNTEDPDPGTPKGTESTQTTSGTFSITDAADLLELVRLRFKLTARKATGCCAAFVHFRPLNPSWQTN